MPRAKGLFLRWGASRMPICTAFARFCGSSNGSVQVAGAKPRIASSVCWASRISSLTRSWMDGSPVRSGCSPRALSITLRHLAGGDDILRRCCMVGFGMPDNVQDVRLERHLQVDARSQVRPGSILSSGSSTDRYGSGARCGSFHPPGFDQRLNRQHFGQVHRIRGAGGLLNIIWAI